MIKPFGVLLVLGLVAALALCFLLALWGIVRCRRTGARKAAAALAIAAAGILALSGWAIWAVAPRGGRTIAELEFPDGRMFVVRHYRSQWLEYPKVRFYARSSEGVWTSFEVIAELVDPGATGLVLDEPAQEIEAPGVGWYRIQDDDFVHPDGSRGARLQLPPGIEPGDEDIHASGQRAP